MVIAKAVAGGLTARIMCQSANRNRILWLTGTRNFRIEVLLVQQRFGDDAVRAMLRSEGRSVDALSVPRQHRAALVTVSRTLYTIKEAELAQLCQVEATRLAQRHALGYWRGLKP
jgi:hypothetical protein